MDLQQNLSNYKNQKSIIDALSDNHIQCNEIKQELETTITQKFDKLDMDQQFTNLDSKIEQNTQKTKELYDKKYIDQQHQQLQTSITQAHNYTKDLEKDLNRLFTKIIADAKNDNRILQKNKIDLELLTNATSATDSSQKYMGKAMYTLQKTVIDLLDTSKDCESFHEFTRELNQKYHHGQDNTRELYEQCYKMMSLYDT